MTADRDEKTWSYGAEHEWADWPVDAKLPRGCAHNRRDHTVMNSNGIANDPAGKTYRFGGEINTRPTPTIGGQVGVLRDLLRALPMASVNFRSNLHVHVRVPGLRDDLDMLRQVQFCVHEWMPRLFDLIAPLPKPSAFQYRDRAALAGAIARWGRCQVSHRTLLSAGRLAKQLAAATPKEFFEAEVPRKGERVLWHLQPRVCVNLRQMMDTDTIEFRHFPGTCDEREFRACLEFCQRFLRAALGGAPLVHLMSWTRAQAFPQFPPYDYALDCRFLATKRDGSVPAAVVAANIKKILDGTFAPKAA